MSSLPDLVVSPIFEIEPIDLIVDLDRYSTLIFTSANAARLLAENHNLRDRVAICVGDKTAATAAMLGMRAISADGNADDLVELIADIRPNPPLLHVRGEIARGDVDTRLTELGLQTDIAIIYRQLAMPLSDEAQNAFAKSAAVVVPLFSPRSAKLVSRGVPETGGPIHVIAMSAQVAKAWNARSDSLTIAPTPDARSMADAVAAFFPA